MSYILVKAPTKEGNMTAKEKAKYLREKAERDARNEATRRRMMGTPELAEEQPKAPRSEASEGTDIAQRAESAKERELVSRPYINPETGETEEDEAMQLTSGAQSEYDKMLAEALEAAQVDTTGTRAKRKDRTFEGGSWRDEEEERGPSEWKQRTDEEKDVRFGRGATTGGTQGERKLGTRAAQLGPTGQQKESGFVAADRAGGPQAVREGKGGREFAPVYKPRAATTNILFEGEKRQSQKERRAEAARRRTHEQRQSGGPNVAAFDAPAARDTDEAYVERNLPRDAHPLDIPHTPMQDAMLGDGRHVSPLRRVLQRYLISNPEELSEFLSMPHLAQYEKQLEDPKNMNDKGYPNERGWHLIDALTEQVMQEMGGGEHQALLDNLGLRMSPGHERNLPPHRSTRAEQKILNPDYLRERGWATDAEIDAKMDQFDKVGANPLAGMEADHAGWERQGEAAGVPDPTRFADQIESLVESGAEPNQALDRVLNDLVEQGVISHTALQEGPEGEQEWTAIQEGTDARSQLEGAYRPSGTLETPEVSPFEHVKGTEKPEDYAVTGAYRGKTTGRFGTPVGEKFIDTAPESDWGSDEAQARVRRIAREKRTEAIQEINDRRTAAGQPPIPVSTRGPDMAPDIPAGIEMDEETRRLLAEMGMNVPAARDETVGELQARQNIQPRQTGPVRNVPQVNPDEDDEISTMDTSGFSLGGQLLKAILDDMLK
tara:strand:- start:2559 stop:4715 length:2157 start_codon:yes stop_codon:yes gene_type:complete